MTMGRVRFDGALSRAQNNHETALAKLLEDCGWVYSCDTPGSRWMWSKEIDGRTLVVDRDTAIEIERVSGP